MTQATPHVSVRRRLESIVLLALLLVMLGLLFDWNWFKGPIERQVQAKTGRSFNIGGNLDGDIGRVLTLRADDLRLGNTPGSPDSEMGRARHVELQIEWNSLLEGDLVVPKFAADHVNLLLERDEQGKGNWTFRDEAGTVDVRQLTINHGSLRVLERERGTDFSVAAQSGVQAPGEARAPLIISGSGRFRGAPVGINGVVESPLELAHQERPYHVDVRAKAGTTQAHVRGDLMAPLQLSGYDLALELSGGNLGDLYPLLGLALPDTPPYRIEGHLHHEHHIWMFRGFHGKVGKSDVAGNAQVEVGRERSMLKAELDSRRLELADLSGFIAVAPGAKVAGAQAEPGRVLPRARYDLPRLRAMDADVKVHAETVTGAPIPVLGLRTRIVMKDGVIEAEPFGFGLAGGSVQGRIRYDARAEPLRAEFDLAARNMDLPVILPDARLSQGSVGRVGGTVKLTGKGDSIADLLGRSNGSVRFGMGEGKVSNYVMEKAGLDLAEMLRFKIAGDRLIPIRCASADFAVEDGVMSTRNLVFDTSDTRVDGEGKVSLRDETLALKLHVRPKDRSPFALRAPLKVEGTFHEPKFGVSKRALTLRALAAGALFALAPPLALAGTAELGGGKDASCPAPGRY